eukprot:5988206-Amphidinium_carterae.2
MPPPNKTKNPVGNAFVTNGMTEATLPIDNRNLLMRVLLYAWLNKAVSPLPRTWFSSHALLALEWWGGGSRSSGS